LKRIDRKKDRQRYWVALFILDFWGILFFSFASSEFWEIKNRCFVRYFILIGIPSKEPPNQLTILDNVLGFEAMAGKPY